MTWIDKLCRAEAVTGGSVPTDLQGGRGSDVSRRTRHVHADHDEWIVVHRDSSSSGGCGSGTGKREPGNGKREPRTWSQEPRTKYQETMFDKTIYIRDATTTLAVNASHFTLRSKGRQIGRIPLTMNGQVIVEHGVEITRAALHLLGTMGAPVVFRQGRPPSGPARRPVQTGPERTARSGGRLVR